MKTSTKAATVVARVIIGLLGLGLLMLMLRSKLDFKNPEKLLMLGAFFGLLLGYAVGGDRWGGRLFGWFSGMEVPEEKPPKKADDKQFLQPTKGD